MCAPNIRAHLDTKPTGRMETDRLCTAGGPHSPLLLTDVQVGGGAVPSTCALGV
uniref:Unnamed protein product n=1 Tax=Macaca fascicularis TaxID=9541 RepID=Q9N098_MACFA|nr:unnamed protein product [Macaca fascicularis]